MVKGGGERGGEGNQMDGYWKSSIEKLMTKENFACLSFFIFHWRAALREAI